MAKNVLFITLDQWRGDCLSAVGHPLLRTPTLDRLAASGTLFSNHWANAAPCGPSRACLYTGTYLHRNRSVQNGTPLDQRFTNVALLAREAGYAPALFGYTDTTLDPRTIPADDPRLSSYENVLPGFDPVLVDKWETGCPTWGKWLADAGFEVPANPHDLYAPLPDFPGAGDHGTTWAPAQFPPDRSQTSFLVAGLIDWLELHGDRPFFVHASFLGPHPPRRNPVGYHDLYDAEQVGPFAAAPTRKQECDEHPFNAIVMQTPGLAAPDDMRTRRQIRATYYGAMREVDDRLADLFDYLDRTGLATDTLVVLTGDHGEMGGDHWLMEKLGYWDESFHIPLIIRDPRPTANPGRGTVVDAFSESVDVLPTICDFLEIEVPRQADGHSLAPFVAGAAQPVHWRTAAHFEWDFSNVHTKLAEQFFGIPSGHCSLAVARGTETKYVQFAAEQDILPALCFDLKKDPMQLHGRIGAETGTSAEVAYNAAQELLRWRMRSDERTLSAYLATRDAGMVVDQADQGDERA